MDGLGEVTVGVAVGEEISRQGKERLPAGVKG